MTVLEFREPERDPEAVESWKYSFDDEGEAHGFKDGVKEDLAGNEDFSFVDWGIEYDTVLRKYDLRLDVLRLTPAPDEAA